MRVREFRNDLNENGKELMVQIMDNVSELTHDLKCMLPNGWRAIVKIVAEADSGDEEELFLLDLQDDKGGGSWAKAKIQTLEDYDFHATYEMSIGQIRDAIRDSGLDDTVFGEEICNLTDKSQLSSSQWSWLLDGKNGPGLAPDFGGMRADCRCHYFNEYDERKVETDKIYIAFSGSKAWQDIQFMLSIFRTIRKRFNSLSKESFEFDLSPFKEYPEIWAWMINLGIVPPPQ